MLTPLELRARCRRIHAQHGLDFVVIDYLQLMHSARNDSRELEISDISRNLKALAKELNIPVLALSQLNRKQKSVPTNAPCFPICVNPELLSKTPIDYVHTPR